MTCGTYHNDAPTTEFMLPNRSAGDMVLKILPPAVQNVLKIPLEGEFLAQGRINAPPYRQRAAEIGIGIVM